MSLVDLVDNTRTDKNTVHAYLDLYQKLIQNKKNTTGNILEIGIGGGGSIQLWNDFFLNANIYSIDITPMNCVFERLLSLKRVTLYTSVDAYDEKIFWSYFVSKNLNFDVILDDGAHTLESMIKFIQLYTQILTKDGILIIEDIPDINWTQSLKNVTPENLKKYITVYDLRHIKNKSDDIVFVIDKSCDNHPQENIEIQINNTILDNFKMINSEYLVDTQCYYNLSGDQEYRLYSYLTTFFENITILDIGTLNGRSAIALSHNNKNKVISYDVLDYINDKNHIIYRKSNIEFRIKNVLDDLTPEFIKNCRLVVIDIDNCEITEKIINKLIQCNFTGIIILDDIHHPDKILNDNMQHLWKNITIPKIDITKYGHWSGSGMIISNLQHINFKF